MNRPGSPHPRSLGPLSAALVGAGFFLLACALAAWGPFNPRAAWLQARPASGGDALSAVRVFGASSGGVDDLADDLLWLRGSGAGLIVLEAWLDQAPQADALLFEAALRTRLEGLPSARARGQALQALSESAAGLDASGRLLAALKASRPLLLDVQAFPGSGAALPGTLEPYSYGVSLKGEDKALPPYHLSRLPWGGAIQAAGDVAAVPPAGGEDQAQALVCVGDAWLNGEGLQAALVARGLPQDALRYHWDKGVLSSLGLAQIKLPLDAAGGVPLPPGQAVLQTFSLDALKGGAGATDLRGKVVFFRPWPLAEPEARAFEAQSRVYLALAEPAAAAAGGGGAPDGLAWAAGLGAMLLLAFAPLWGALPLWGLLPWGVFRAASGSPGSMVQGTALALAVLCLGLGWRLYRAWRARLASERLFRGRLAPEHWPAWSARLRGGTAAFPAAYAVIGPRAALSGPAWEAWMERWGLLLDEALPVDATGLIAAGPSPEETLAGALVDARRHLGGVSGGLARGTLSFRREERLGSQGWQVEGPVRDGALELFGLAEPSQILVTQTDGMAFGAFLEIRPCAEGPGSAPGLGLGPLLKIIGPNADLWTGRPQAR